MAAQLTCDGPQHHRVANLLTGGGVGEIGGVKVGWVVAQPQQVQAWRPMPAGRELQAATRLPTPPTSHAPAS